ncbi:MAG: type II toxin-antitoxin system RelE/ParE family toxin [Betaproteobacteria bacterium]
MRIVWTAQAEVDREEAIEYIGVDAPLAAAGQLDHILAQVQQLTDYPKLGRVGRVRGTRELVIAHTPFVLIYRVRADSVLILRLLHGARRWPPVA